MKIVKILVGLLILYAVLVAGFETLLGYSQPTDDGTITIVTTDNDGTAHERVLSRINYQDTLYVAVNHWPRAWYRHLLERPDVTIRMDGTQNAYTAVPVSNGEFERVNAHHPLPLSIRILTGFPPRRIVRLDPRQAG